MAGENLEFNLIDFRIISSSFNLHEDKITEAEGEFSINLGMKHDFIPQDKILRLFLKIDFGGKDVPCTLAVEGRALFEFSKIIEDPLALRRIAEINCAGIAYPYIREVVADMTRRGGLPPLHVPPVNFVHMYKTNHPDDGGADSTP